MSGLNEIRPTPHPIPLSAILPQYTGSVQVSGASMNSKDIAPGDLFIGAPGAKAHGARFADAAVASGAVAVLTDAAGAELVTADVPVVLTENVRAVIGSVSAAVYGRPTDRLLTIGVTGTNGKTTTTFMIRGALETAGHKVALSGTVETRVGPWQVDSAHTTAEAPVLQRIGAAALDQGCDAYIVETSSHAISFGRVEEIAYDVLTFTNLQHDHLDFYGDLETYFQAKASLFTPEHTRAAVICVDDDYGLRLANSLNTRGDLPVVTVSAIGEQALTTPADWRVSDAHEDPHTARMNFTLTGPDGVARECSAAVPGIVNVQDASVAIVSAVTAGVPLEQAIAGVAEMRAVPGRMEVYGDRSKDEPLVVVDFAHTPEAIEKVFESMRPLTPGRLITVIGSDGDRDAEKRPIIGQVIGRSADLIVLTDENPRSEEPAEIRAQIRAGVEQVRPDLHDFVEITTCRRDAIRWAIQHANSQDTVTITGKGNEPYQEIQGVHHKYNDVPVLQEVLEARGRSHSGSI
ncbi:MAG: UDP-N-acetylmuramoyl-L-alanyl-D-glutamate--2,6-diaminopimelate ligase [Varibaculum sp.]|nr:UDP-N-acetylmuramoyl-L-alanyl-D-glutamate--2,6-diaminopimelate ligase [Varibaculum sp.]